jgi:AraC-like DNA-binding protein
MGVSIRHLRRVVARDAGVSVKRYSRTVRLLQAVLAADDTSRRSPLSWTRIAFETGYYDQSHLSLDCRALCGLTPDQIHRERRSEESRTGT